MKKSIKDKWVKALRSGKYEQGKNYLHSADGKFCCLGVLCDISPVTSHRGVNTTSYGLLRLESSLPSEVMEWSGISTSVGTFKNREGYFMSLAEYNDGKLEIDGVDRPATFLEIADWLDCNYKAL